jgi:hypothetical protein
LTGADFHDALLVLSNFTGADLTGLTGAVKVMDEFTVSTFKPKPIKQLSPSYKAIPRNQTGFHIFKLEVDVLEYLKSDEGIDTVAFLYHRNYYLIDKSTLAELINPHSVSVVYVEHFLHMKVEFMGIPLRTSYVPVPEIEYVLKTSNKIEDRMFELVSTDDKKF